MDFHFWSVSARWTFPPNRTLLQPPKPRNGFLSNARTYRTGSSTRTSSKSNCCRMNLNSPLGNRMSRCRGGGRCRNAGDGRAAAVVRARACRNMPRRHKETTMNDTTRTGRTELPAAVQWISALSGADTANNLWSCGQALLKVLTDMNAGTVCFMGRRLSHNGEAIGRMAQCRSLPDWFGAEAGWPAGHLHRLRSGGSPYDAGTGQARRERDGGCRTS